jgi:hypothetical protein
MSRTFRHRRGWNTSPKEWYRDTSGRWKKRPEALLADLLRQQEERRQRQRLMLLTRWS